MDSCSCKSTSRLLATNLAVLIRGSAFSAAALGPVDDTALLSVWPLPEKAWTTALPDDDASAELFSAGVLESEGVEASLASSSI